MAANPTLSRREFQERVATYNAARDAERDERVKERVKAQRAALLRLLVDRVRGEARLKVQTRWVKVRSFFDRFFDCERRSVADGGPELVCEDRTPAPVENDIFPADRPVPPGLYPVWESWRRHDVN